MFASVDGLHVDVHSRNLSIFFIRSQEEKFMVPISCMSILLRVKKDRGETVCIALFPEKKNGFGRDAKASKSSIGFISQIFLYMMMWC